MTYQDKQQYHNLREPLHPDNREVGIAAEEFIEQLMVSYGLGLLPLKIKSGNFVITITRPSR